MEKLEAVLFDWAGTSMDYGCYAPAVVFRKVFEDMGVPISMTEAREPMGAHKKVHIRAITQIDDVNRRWKEARGAAPTEEDVEQMFEKFVPAQMACLADYADLIPGCLDAVAEVRRMGLKIGSTTGYTGEMMRLLMSEAEKRGYTPDVTVCSTGHYAVREGNEYRHGSVQGIGKDWNISRPGPHMCTLNAALLGVSEPYHCVKVGDTLPDITEGRKAGMWTIGLAMTGNEVGLNEEELNALSLAEYNTRRRKAYRRMRDAGANVILTSIRTVPAALAAIDELAVSGKSIDREYAQISERLLNA